MTVVCVSVVCVAERLFWVDDLQLYWLRFAKPISQSQSIVMDWLCFAIPFHFVGFVSFSKPFWSCRIDFAAQSQSIYLDWLCFAKPFHHDWIGFASQSQSFVMDWLCFAKPIHFDRSTLLRKVDAFLLDLLCFAKPFHHDRNGFASQSQSFVMDWLCFAKPIYCDRSTLLRKAYPSWWICFASQSLSIMMDGLCFAKPFQWWIGFASQSQSILIGLLCFAKPIHCGGLEWLCFAKPFQWFCVQPFLDFVRGYAVTRGYCVFPGFRPWCELRACGVHPVSRCAPFLPVDDKT